jgi:soluble lytic murein transglycosylase-like protein
MSLQILTLLLSLTNGANRCLAPEPADVTPLQELVEKRAFVLQTKLEPNDSFTIATAATEVGEQFKLSPVFILALIEIESRYNKKAKSKKGCQGLVQLSKQTSKYLIVKFHTTGDVFVDIRNNIFLGIAYLHELIEQQGNLLKAVTIYNKGYGNWVNNPHISGYALAVNKRYKYLKSLLIKDELTCRK